MQKVRLWKCATGTAKIGNRYISFGLKGAADLTGILCDGTRLEIEVKSGAATQSEEQKNFQKMIEKYGGIYILARSEDDAVNQLQEICRLRGISLF